MAIRALSDVHMLVNQDRNRPPTVSQRFGGDMTVGLVIDPHCIDGFDLAAFNVADQAGGRDAGAPLRDAMAPRL